jgi:DNA polymerase-3 subunit alpha
MAALLTSVLGNIPKTGEYIAECHRHGITVCPPNINESYAQFHADRQKGIRFGLGALKNIGVGFIDAVVRERESGGAFASLDDFITRMSGRELNRRQVEGLIKAGAFDGLGVFRSQLMSAYSEIIESINRKAHGSVMGQLDMFSSDTVQVRYPDIPEYTLREKLRFEKESAGMYFSGHILDDYGKNISDLTHANIRAVLEHEYKEKQSITIVGAVTSVTKKVTKNGDLMLFISLEDRSGEIEVLVFPKTVTEYGAMLSLDNAIALEGEVSYKDDEVKILMRRAKPLISDDKYVSAPKEARTKASADKAQKLYLKVDNMSSPLFKRAIAVCEIFEGNTPVVIYESDTKRYVSSSITTSVTEFVLNELQEILGNGSVVTK